MRDVLTSKGQRLKAGTSGRAVPQHFMQTQRCTCRCVVPVGRWKVQLQQACLEYVQERTPCSPQHIQVCLTSKDRSVTSLASAATTGGSTRPLRCLSLCTSD